MNFNLKQVLPEVDCLDQIKQSPVHHPEGNVFIHTLKAMDHATDRSAVVMWSLLLHDIGKANTGEIQANGNIAFHGHDKAGAEIASQIMDRMKVSSKFKSQVVNLIEKHMWINQIDQMKRSTLIRKFNRDNGQFLRDLAVVHHADAMGSNGDISAVSVLNDFLNNQTVAVQTGVKQVFVTGDDLIKLGFKPGKGFGDILKKVNDLFFDGVVTDISQIDFDDFR